MRVTRLDSKLKNPFFVLLAHTSCSYSPSVIPAWKRFLARFSSFLEESLWVWPHRSDLTWRYKTRTMLPAYGHWRMKIFFQEIGFAEVDDLVIASCLS